jgi:hypothetical protein
VSPNPGPEKGDERRQDIALRELVQDLLVHVRDLSSKARNMSDRDLDYAQQRLEWLADEVWRAVTEMEERGGR